MSSLNADSTNEEVWDSYDDNSSFEEDSSVAKARAFITAANILLRRRPLRSVVGSTDMQFDAKSVQDQLAYARQYVANNATSSTGTRPSRPAVVSWDLSRLRGC